MIHFKHLVTTLLLFCISLEMNAQSKFTYLTERLPSYESSVDLEKLTKQDTLSIEAYNEVFLNYPRKPEKIRPFFYGIDDTKKSDGNVGRLGKSFDYIDHRGREATYYNKVFPIGILSLSKEYFSIVLRKEVFDFISVDLYNFDRKGILLSAVKLFEYSRGPLSQGGEVQYTIISSDVSQEGIIHQQTEADFIIDRKFILDPDGHFRVIEEEIKDFE